MHVNIPTEAQTVRRVCAVGEDAHPTSEWKMGTDTAISRWEHRKRSSVVGVLYKNTLRVGKR